MKVVVRYLLYRLIVVAVVHYVIGLLGLSAWLSYVLTVMISVAIMTFCLRASGDEFVRLLVARRAARDAER